MVKRKLLTRWGRGVRLREVDTREFEKVGKQGRFNIYARKQKTSKKAKQQRTKATKKSLEQQKVAKTNIRRKFQPRKINEVFQKKIAKIEIPDLLNIPTHEINNYYKPLLKQVLNKKSLGDLASESVLNAMVQQDNINKIKWRFEMRSNIYDLDGTLVAQMNKGSGGDLQTLRELTKKGIWRGARVDYDIDLGQGYVYKMNKQGNVARVEVTIIFRS